MSDREPVTGGREPLALAAWKRSPLALIGALPAGGGLLGILAAGGADIGYLDVLAAVAVMLATAFPSLAALRGVVREVRPLVTPSAAPRNSAGDRLVPIDQATLARALAQARVARATSAKRPPPDRSVPEREPDPTAGGYHQGPRPDPTAAWEPARPDDWTGEAAAEHDEARAAGVQGTRYMPEHRAGTPRPIRRPRRTRGPGTGSTLRPDRGGGDFGPIP